MDDVSSVTCKGYLFSSMVVVYGYCLVSCVSVPRNESSIIWLSSLPILI